FGGGGAPRPPRPLAPARPLAGSGAADAAAGVGGGGADSAASSGARSASVDHRDRVIVSAPAVASLVIVARRLSAAMSLDAVRPPASNASTRAVAAATNVVVLRTVIVVRTPGAAQPLHQPLHFLVFQPGAALPHVNDHHAPLVGTVARVVVPIRLVARRARPLQQRLGLGVGKE